MRVAVTFQFLRQIWHRRETYSRSHVRCVYGSRGSRKTCDVDCVNSVSSPPVRHVIRMGKNTSLCHVFLIPRGAEHSAGKVWKNVDSIDQIAKSRTCACAWCRENILGSSQPGPNETNQQNEQIHVKTEEGIFWPSCEDVLRSC